MSANDAVLKVLKESGEPMKAGDIAEVSGLDKKEIDKAIKALKDEGKIASPKRCFYTAAE